MHNLTEKEIQFIKEEAKKIKGLELLKIVVTHLHATLLTPPLELLENDNQKVEATKEHKRKTKESSLALRQIKEVAIDIVEEAVYIKGTKNQAKTVEKGHYSPKVTLKTKTGEIVDQTKETIFYPLRGAVFHLEFHIENLLRGKLDDFRKKLKEKPKFKKSGHLVDQILKVAPREYSTLDLFSELSEETRTEIEKENLEITRELFSGVNLTASEMKIQDTFSILLSQQSQTEEPEKPNYYTGIEGKKQDSFLGGKGAIAPSIEFSLYTIAKEFKGGKTPTGKDLENVKNILQELEKKKFLIKHKEIYSKKGGGKTTIERQGYRALFYLDKITLTQEDKNGRQINKAETMVVVLNPIYRQQIESKYILQPLDIIQQLTIANGSPNIPLATYNLKEYLFRELSSKHYECKITARKLYETLEPKLMKVPRMKQAQENTTRAINTMISLGLLEKYEIGKSQIGETMFTFYLNKSYL